ncbi:hypothetical protein Tco_1123574 [Tanacetum coccineum]|uniref:Uncharacterized protein n=1 Tax=Tanacetum coccineum TaxID=301880 RepID=A0ABQ5J404_9ASTR
MSPSDRSCFLSKLVKRVLDQLVPEGVPSPLKFIEGMVVNKRMHVRWNPHMVRMKFSITCGRNDRVLCFCGALLVFVSGCGALEVRKLTGRGLLVRWSGSAETGCLCGEGLERLEFVVFGAVFVVVVVVVESVELEVLGSRSRSWEQLTGCPPIIIIIHSYRNS